MFRAALTVHPTKDDATAITSLLDLFLVITPAGANRPSQPLAIVVEALRGPGKEQYRALERALVWTIGCVWQSGPPLSDHPIYIHRLKNIKNAAAAAIYEEYIRLFTSYSLIASFRWSRGGSWRDKRLSYNTILHTSTYTAV